MSSLLENVISCISTEKFDVTGKVEMRFNFLKYVHILLFYILQTCIELLKSKFPNSLRVKRLLGMKYEAEERY